MYFGCNVVAWVGLYADDRWHVLPSLSRALEMSVSDFMADNPQLLISQGHLQSGGDTYNVNIFSYKWKRVCLLVDR